MSERIEGDLVIVGAGAAGMPAAIHAADGGLRVVLLERQPVVGGTLPYAGGQISAGGVEHQSRKGLVDSPEQHAEDLLRIGLGYSDPELVALATREAPGMIAWLESIGVEFDPESPQIMPAQEPYSVARTYWASGNRAGRGLHEAVEPELQRRVESGAIRLVLEARATGVARTPGGGWEVQAETPEGTLTATAPVLVLATGGYIANRQLWSTLHPGMEAVLPRSRPHAEGDGLLLGQAAGGQVSHAEAWVPAIGAIEDPDSPGTAIGAALLNIRSRMPAELWIGPDGRRFVREDEPDKRTRELPVLALPGQRFFIVFDEAVLTGYKRLVPGWTPERVREEAARGRFLWSGSTIAELAERCGLPAGALVETVARYNQAVELGRDEEFGREFLPFALTQPPFYALRCGASATVSYAGLRVSPDLEVLDADGKPIPGLYAAGEVIGAGKLMGRASASGMALGPALALGRYLGRRLAERLARR